MPSDLILSNVSGDVSLSPDAAAAQDGVMRLLNAVVSVDSDAALAQAVDAIQQANTLTKSVKDVGMAIRRPINAYAERVITLEKQFNRPIEEGVKRAKTLIASYQDAKALRLLEAERERLHQIRQLQIAEQELKEQAAVALACAATNGDDEMGRPDVEAANRALALQDMAEDKAVEALSLVMTHATPSAKPKGLATSKVWVWDFTDRPAAYAAHPEFFELVDVAAAIRPALHEGFECPGMRFWQETRTIIRKA